MKRFGCLLVLVLFLGQFQSAVADEKIKLKNALNQNIEIRIFSEKELKWIKPSIKLEKGKAATWTVPFDGDHNIKLIMGKKEYLMGTYDLRSIIKQKKVDEIEFGYAKAATPSKKPSGKPDSATDKPKTSDKKGSGKKDPPPKDEKPKAKPGKGVKIDRDKYRVETRTRTVKVTKTRTETRMREVIRADGTTVTVPYTVRIPYMEEIEQTYQVLVPKDGGKTVELKSGQAAEGNSGASSNSSSKPVLTFRSAGKVVQVKDSLQRK